MDKGNHADHKYTADSIKSLDWRSTSVCVLVCTLQLGDGSSEDDGIYALLKEVLDNCIDEFVMGFGKQIEVECDGQVVTVRDYGREFPGKAARLFEQDQYWGQVRFRSI